MHLRTYAEMVTAIQNLARDTTPVRWTAAETRRALSRAVEGWNGRVSVEAVYTLPGGWSTNQYEYELPDYVRYAIRPQAKHAGDADDVVTWSNVNRFTVHANANGGRTLHVDSPPDGDGRILYRTRNSPAPTTDPALSVSLASADTSATVGTVIDAAETGWAKIDGEWIQYAGVTRGTSSTTLDNLVRAGFGTAAATHSIAATVFWGIAAPSQELFTQLYDQTLSYLHEMFITNGSPTEQETHERMMLFYEERTKAFWRRWTPSAPIMTLAERVH